MGIGSFSTCWAWRGLLRPRTGALRARVEIQFTRSIVFGCEQNMPHDPALSNRVGREQADLAEALRFITQQQPTL